MAWYNSSWQYRKKITVDHTKVSSLASNFPVLISLTDANLKNTANGGHVGKSNGGDILFTSSDGTTKLKHEIQKYVNSTGQLIAWVKVPSLLSSADTDLYLYYGYASAGDQADPTNAWNNDYRAVWHMNQDPSGSGKVILDSKGSGTTYDGDPNEMESADLVAGKIGNALNFDGSPEGIVLDTGLSWPTAAITIQFWIKPDAAGYPMGLLMETNNNKGGYVRYLPAGNFRLGLGNGSSLGELTTSSTYSTGSWYLVHLTWDDSDDTMRIYVNGSADSNTLTLAGPIVWGASYKNSFIATAWNITNGGNQNGIMDEVRVLNAALPSGWIATEYNNHNSPSTFYSVGSEQTPPIGFPIITDGMAGNKIFSALIAR
jgi:hypothetical protein